MSTYQYSAANPTASSLPSSKAAPSRDRVDGVNAMGVSMSDVKSRLEQVYESLTPGAIERADLDGMAFAVRDAIVAIERDEANRLLAASNEVNYALSLAGGSQ